MATVGQIAIPEEGLLFTNDRIKLKIGNTDLDYGVLFLTGSSLGWKPNNRPESVTIPWQKISIHAITGDPRRVYFMLDINLTWPGVYDGRAQNNGNGNGIVEDEDEDDEGHESDESENAMTELWISPEDTSLIDVIYNVMIDCQAMNPDRDALDSVSEDEDFMEAEDDENGQELNVVEEVGQGDLRNLHLDDEDKYADAEEN